MAHWNGSNPVMAEYTLPRRTSESSGAERVDAVAAVAGSLAAGSVFLMLLVALSMGVYDEPAWKIPQLIASTLRGAEPSRHFEPTFALLGIALHFALSALYGLAFAGLAGESRHANFLGIVFGVALYFTNLYGFTNLFAWFAELRTLDTLAAHAVFGLLLAHFYRYLAER